jgi:hypothetical protein
MQFIEPRERAPRSSRPRWMRGCSDKVKTSRDGRKYIAEIGWELKPENRMYTTCLKFTEVKTTWRR